VSPTKKPLIPYIRQSRTSERTISLTEQWAAIERVARDRGFHLTVNSFDDADAAGLVERSTSGNKAWRTRSLGMAIAACQDGRASGVIVYDQSRLSREDLLGTAEVWDALDKASADLIEAATGGSKVKRMEYVIKAEMNRQQWELARDRSAQARSNAIARGVHIGTTPLGYRRVGRGNPLEVDPDTAPAVQAAWQARANGASWSQISRDLGKAVGRPCSMKATEQMCRSRTYLGEVRSGPFVKAGAHPPLVSLAVFEKVQANRVTAGPRQRRKPGLLTGVIRCGNCGHRMTQDWNTRGPVRADFYRCPDLANCGHRAGVMHKIVEPVVVDQVVDAYLGVFGKTATPEDRTPELEAAVNEAEAELTAYLTAVSATTPGFAEGVKVREAVLIEAREALAGYSPTSAAPPKAVLVELKELAAENDEAARDMLRGLIQRVVESVDVKPGRMPVAEKVSIRWKDGTVTPAGATDVRVLLRSAAKPKRRQKIAA
jgi:DNA invertase Pin-like site-specific DNA recombinase